MQAVKIVKVVVAGPSDVRAECDHIQSVLDELNRTMAADRGLRLEYHNWRQDAYPGLHPFGPQGIVDRALNIAEAELVIALFWKRFGTPIPSGETGTEHEITAAYDRWRQTRKPDLMLYFNQAEMKFSNLEEVDQYRAVRKFREDLPGDFFLGEYCGEKEFRDKIRRDLENWLGDKWRVGDAAVETSRGRRSIYIANVAGDLKGEREALIREVEAQDWEILPGPLLITDESELREKIGEFIKRCELTVHLAGSRHSHVAELEAEVAQEAARKRFLWVQPKGDTADAKQIAFLKSFPDDSDLRGFRRWEVPFEEFRQDLIQELRKKPGVAPGTANAYLVFSPEDREDAAQVSRELFELGLEVVEPPELGAGFSEAHRESLERCRGAMFYWGHANPDWFNQMYRAVRLETVDRRVRWIVLAKPPETKQRVPTHRAKLVEAYDGVSPDLLRRFAAEIREILAVGA